MLTASELYKRYLLKINKNDSETNIKVRKSQFVRMFNEYKDKQYEWILKLKNDSDLLDDIEKLKKTHIQLELKSSFSDRSVFELPIDMFKLIRSHVIVSKGGCTVSMYNDRPNTKNVHLLLKDEFHKPSFEYEETLIELASGMISVYKSDFDIDSCYISYWSEIEPIDVEGYIKANGSQSKDYLDKRLTERFINKVIDRIVQETETIYENPDGFQLSARRVQEDNIG